MHNPGRQAPPTVSPPQPAALDVQRDALRELVALCTDCATTEAQLEETFQNQIAAAERKLQSTLADIEQRFGEQRQSIETEYEVRLGTANEDYDRTMSQLAGYDSVSHDNLENELETAAQDLNSKIQQALWLAESVHEAAQIQFAKEYKQAKEQHVQRKQELEELMNQGSSLVASFGQPELVTQVVVAASSGEIGSYELIRDSIKRQLSQIKTQPIPRLFAGIWPVVACLVVLGVAASIAQISAGGVPDDFGTIRPEWRAIGIGLIAAMAFCIVVGFLLRIVGRSQVRRAYIPLRAALEEARRASDHLQEQARADRDSRLARATRKRDTEVQLIQEKYAPFQARVTKNREAAVTSVEADIARRAGRIEQQRAAVHQSADAWKTQSLSDLSLARQDETDQAQAIHDQAVLQAQQSYQSSKQELKQRWTQGIAKNQSPIQQKIHTLGNGQLLQRWDDSRWGAWSPPTTFVNQIRFGELEVDLKQMIENHPHDLEIPPRFSVPASISYPNRASLLIHTDHARRDQAIRIQQMVMARLLTQLPAGRVRFTIIDPVGLGQNFAGFMHLADHDEALVGQRIWTESEQIEQQLANLTEHMETVIQKYLRNEFETIDQYNAQAGELAEPYRYLVIADFPVAFEGDSFRRLNSIATSGARCGVFTLVVRDTRQPLPSGVHLDELEANSINLVRSGDGFAWRDEILQQFPLKIDPAPDEQFLTRILDVVGTRAKESKRVEVPFETIAPQPKEIWSRQSREDLQVPIGRLGATRLQSMRLGRGVAQHALIAGKTGSGKSTLLHVLVTNLALWYSPDEVEFYLVDFKKGVEFKTYATHALPHARAIAVESDREFGLSVLQRIDAELARRGELFRKLGVQDLAAYRTASKQPLPRTLLIIDEFQEFFSEDDKLAQEATLLLDRLVRQGRAFGIHVLLGSQTIGGTSGLARSTLGQMAVRIALQTSEADSQLILGDTNSAARLLSRPGEAIYNDAGGLVEANSPFQISWLGDAQRERYLDLVRQRSAQQPTSAAEPIVFEGNAPADITRNRILARHLQTPGAPIRPAAPLIWLGDPVAIKDPTSIALRRQSGANVLVIGQNEEAGMALIAAAMISLAAQYTAQNASAYLLDGTPADSSLAGTLPRIAAALPLPIKPIDYRAVPEAVAEIAAEIQRRQSAEHQDHPPIFVFIYGLQRYRMLRKSEDSFAFSSGGEEKPPEPDKLLNEILREGPAMGVHIIGWIDTAVSIERTFDRGTMREFDHRVMFQMSATDSSNLIDSPAANKLGFHRALSYSEEQGVMEKFRPYALPPKEWLQTIVDAMKRRQ